MVARFTAITLTLGGALLAHPAAAGEIGVAECIAASEKGQELRRDHKLLEAAERFRDCSVASCPAAVRDDCKREQRETVRMTPRVRVVVRASTAQLESWSLEIDGQPAMKEGGVVNPGTHTFRVESKGYRPQSKVFRVEEGAIDSEEITLTPDAAVASEKSADFLESDTILGVSLAGAGAIGVILGSTFGLLARSDYDDALAQCGPGGRSACSSAGISRREDASDKAAFATWTFGAGTALVAAGVIVLLVAPRLGSSKATASIARAGITW